MNLLTDRWIPVRPLNGVDAQKLTLRELLCTDGRWELCLPRDDMELAALQLLICMSQCIIIPANSVELRELVKKPLAEAEYDAAILPVADWFQLGHPNHPFMQVPKVQAKEPTPMDKLLAGVTGARNCCFVNEPRLAEQLCGGCASIALFNLGSCSPSFGGGFKPGLRGPSAPITTLNQGRHLRETVWLNVLAEEEINRIMPWYTLTRNQKPTWIEPIKSGERLYAQQIGLKRGLLWQPASVEVSPSPGGGRCTCCGFEDDQIYTSFRKAKFNYSIVGTWPHPHSPLIMVKTRDDIEERIASFSTSTAPSWTQLARIVIRQEIDSGHTEGHQPAAVVQQASKIYGQGAQKLHLLIGGYLNKAGQASILGRRHESFTLNHGWDSNTKVIYDLVSLGRGYRDALWKALAVFVNGMKNAKGAAKVKGAGVKLNVTAETQFYRRSEPTIEDALARIDFANPESELSRMRSSLKLIAEELFKASVLPYLNDPELIKTLAVARRVLHKHLNELEPQKQ